MTQLPVPILEVVHRALERAKVDVDAQVPERFALAAEHVLAAVMSAVVHGDPDMAHALAVEARREATFNEFMAEMER